MKVSYFQHKRSFIHTLDFPCLYNKMHAPMHTECGVQDLQTCPCTMRETRHWAAQTRAKPGHECPYESVPEGNKVGDPRAWRCAPDPRGAPTANSKAQRMLPQPVRLSRSQTLVSHVSADSPAQRGLESPPSGVVFARRCQSDSRGGGTDCV